MVTWQKFTLSVCRKREILISLLFRMVYSAMYCPENRRSLRIVSCDISLSEDTFPLCFQDVLFWIKDKHEVEKVDLYLQIKEKLVSLRLCFLFTSPLDKTFQILSPGNFSIQRVNRIENIEQPRHKLI